jgi:NADP-dependent 3-hydroxy acid dehydrogenase YdfG
VGDLDGRRVVITGGTSGIGAATARVTVDRGAAVVVIGRRADRLTAMADELGIAGVRADIADEGSIRAGMEEAADAIGGIDALVNNAGAMIHSRPSDGYSDDWRRMVDVNVLGLLHATNAALPFLRRSGFGDIVNVSSTAARRIGRPEYTLYSATKSAVEFLSRGLRMDLAGEDIRVSIVSPGLVAGTGFGHDIRDDELRREMLATKDERGIDAALVGAQICAAMALPREARIDEIVIVPSWQVT